MKRQLGGLQGQVPNGLQVQVLLSQSGNPVHREGRLVVFLRWHESQMPLGKDLLRHPRDGTQHWKIADLPDRFAQYRLVPRTGRPIQDHSTKKDLRVEPLTSQDGGRDRTCRLGAVDRENDRRLQQFGQLGRTIRAPGVQPVEQAAVTLDDGDVGT